MGDEVKGVGVHGLCVCITMKTGLISLDRFGHGFVSLAIGDVGVCWINSVTEILFPHPLRMSFLLPIFPQCSCTTVPLWCWRVTAVSVSHCLQSSTVATARRPHSASTAPSAVHQTPSLAASRTQVNALCNLK